MQKTVLITGKNKGIGNEISYILKLERALF